MALTDSQLQTLATGIRASTDPVCIAALAIRDDVGLEAWCNSSSTFVVWKTWVPKESVGQTIQATAFAAITAGNNDKLSSFAAWNPNGVNPSRQDTRDFFADIFSVAAGAGTRTALTALWKRFATQAERFWVSGTGTDATPGQLGAWQGSVTYTDVGQALNRF